MLETFTKHVKTYSIVYVLFAVVVVSAAIFSWFAYTIVQTFGMECLLFSDVIEPAPDLNPSEIEIDEPMSPVQFIDATIEEVARCYELDSYLVKSIVYQESRYNKNAVSSDGSTVGLMQISPKWHAKRAEKLGVTDFTGIYGNLMVGCDYLHDLLQEHEDPRLALMLYNQTHDSAFRSYNAGRISNYAKEVIKRADYLRNGGVLLGYNPA